jgi:serine/threonine protein kinase
VLLTAGDRINDFEVLHHLGTGGYGTVYACLWDMDGREYAVKMLSGSIDDARREFTALQDLHHPNVVKCIHAGSIAAGGWYIQCELVKGRPLSEWVEGRVRFSSEEAIDIAGQLLAALNAIHPRR